MSHIQFSDHGALCLIDAEKFLPEWSVKKLHVVQYFTFSYFHYSKPTAKSVKYLIPAEITRYTVTRTRQVEVILELILLYYYIKIVYK